MRKISTKLKIGIVVACLIIAVTILFHECMIKGKLRPYVGEIGDLTLRFDLLDATSNVTYNYSFELMFNNTAYNLTTYQMKRFTILPNRSYYF